MDVVRKYGWKRDAADHRDLKFKDHMMVHHMVLPPKVDLTSGLPEVYDQQSLGSCTSQAAAALAQFLMKKEGHEVFMPSRLAIYYWERELEGTIEEDSGASIRDSLRVLNANGVAHEELWPYDIPKFKERPNQLVVEDASKHKVIKYARLDQSIGEFKNCLASGFPFVFGFTVFPSFESQEVAKTGMMPMPTPGEQPLGGHAICCVGYDDDLQRFLIRNSWGSGWALSGYFWMPFSFIQNQQYANDFWVATLIA